MGTTTNSEVNFTLSVPNNANTLVVSSVNMATQELSIGSETNFTIALKAGDVNLQEVVVTSFGIRRDKKTQQVTLPRLLAEKI
ncbi:MAG: carboxypeptidase-like regulatory domain-containing protein [Chitinophagaceae bacterium]